MKILQLYNNYKSGGGGETTMVRDTESILRQHGHTVLTLERDNHAITSVSDKVRAFFGGIYSPQAKVDVEGMLDEVRPDIVHIFNLYPLFSPSVIQAARGRGVPVVMSVQNHQLTCPTASHFSHAEVCQRCMGGREYNCVLRNCKGSLTQSAGYALRSAVASRAGWYREGVSRFLVISQAVRQRMLEDSYDDAKITVVPNSVPIPERILDPTRGSYVGYVGRLTVEKGISVLLEAARISGVPVTIAGGGDELSSLKARAPANVRFTGWMDRNEIAAFYQGARFTVVPSVWPEPFGLVATEAMSYGLPVIAARSGALPEIIQHGNTGYLYKAEDATELASHLRLLWDTPEECLRLGRNGRAAVIERFSIEQYYENLMRVYEAVLADRTC